MIVRFEGRTAIMRTGAKVSAVTAALLLAVGCTGSIDGDPGAPGTGNNGNGNNTGGSGGPVVPGNPGDPSAAGPMPLRRMTRAEFNNTMRDLIGDATGPANAFPL